MFQKTCSLLFIFLSFFPSFFPLPIFPYSFFFGGQTKASAKMSLSNTFHRHLSDQHSNHSFSNCNSYIPSKRTPLQVPELLRIIFSFLSPHCLRFSVGPVCRQWYDISKAWQLANSVVTWTEIWQEGETLQEQVLQQIDNGAQHLVMKTLGLSTYYKTHPESWTGLLEHLQLLSTPVNDQQQQQQQYRRYLQIKDLKLEGILEAEAHLFPLLTIIGYQLTCIEVDHVRTNQIPINKILCLCPQLLTFRWINSRGMAAYYGAAILQEEQDQGEKNENEDEKENEEEEEEEERNEDKEAKSMTTAIEAIELPARLRLRSLTLGFMFVERTALKRLLQACPDLEELCLKRLQRGRIHLLDGFPYLSTQYASSLFEGMFLSDLTASCPKLVKAHFSGGLHDGWAQRTPSQVDGIFEELACVKHWSFWSMDFTRATYLAFLKRQQSQLMDHTLTTLEIIDTNSVGDWCGNLLHSFLCEARQLRHLKAPHVQFSIAWFDIEEILDDPEETPEYHGDTIMMDMSGALHMNSHTDTNSDMDTINSSSSSSSPPSPPSRHCKKIWACRNLSTLQIACAGRSWDRSRRDLAARDCRIMFGYLSKMVPNLEELSLRLPKIPTLDLGTGLCLLTRMHKLERLEIKSIEEIRSPIPWNVDWIQKRLSTAQKLKLRLRLTQASFKQDFASNSHSKDAFEPNIATDNRDSLKSHDGQEQTILSNDVLASSSSSLSHPDYIIDGVDTRNIGCWQDIVSLLQDRMNNDWCCWPRMEHIDIGSDDGVSDCSNSLNKLMDAIKKYRPTINVVRSKITPPKPSGVIINRPWKCGKGRLF
ncbi:hypothetical protein BCR41DRAFT_344368 [Lobosporangium transversale]|uniref:F-box domain-containing protein n=1 Tax=Lobosporangium transversale TaxID=64571 RepID=A0A1Y2H366_9FUNG|nr:hypothetical protein BCR41DRAFT_344368 [Lobosporangium transversale]ORZ28976.1 hypothetical protein BCR41DRAFT_344368 [Lobosporangium transversale]|eukprot:XP_021886649.1 hypothetical protein BCR41DRAFT_344368 [Lobosporangium transversale]